MPASPSRFRLRWHTVIIAALTLGLLWWFFRTLDLREVGRSIARAHLSLLVLAIAVTFQTYVLRTWRWQTLLLPIGGARFGPAFRTTVIGFTATFLLPGRVGEVLRPYLLAREEHFSASAAFATIVVERVLDLVAVLFLFSLFMLTTPIDVGHDIKIGGVVAAIVAVVALVLMAVFAGHPQRLGAWSGALTRALPGRAAERATHMVHTFVEGLAVMRRPGVLLASMALSLLVWLSIALGIWLTSLAFDLTFPFTGSFLVILFLVIGVAVPTPSGLGTFHWAYRFAVTTFFAASADRAAAAAIVLHAVSFVPTSLLGLAFMARDGLSLGRLRALESTAEVAESAGEPGAGVPETPAEHEAALSEMRR